MVSVLRAFGVAVALLGSPLLAQSSAITESARSFGFSLHGNDFTISRQGPSCPPSCVQPMQVSPGVDTFGELEVISFLQSTASQGSGLLIDARGPNAFSTGTVPGAVNVPVATFAPDNPYRTDLLSALGVLNADSTPNFGGAFSLVIFGAGPDDAAAPDAINALLDAGYPAGKISYYRGGTSEWSRLGLSVAAGQ